MKKLLLFLLCAAFDHAYATTNKLRLKDNSMHEVTENFINENSLLKNIIVDTKDDDSIVSVPNDFVTHATLQQLEAFIENDTETVGTTAQKLAPETLANTLLAADFLGSKHTEILTTVLAKKLLRNKALPGISHLFETLETVKGKQGIKEIHNDAVRRNLVDEILKNELPLKLLHILKGHAGFVNSAQFSPDGTQIVTASNDNTARLWSATTGELLRTLEGHAGGVTSAQFSPDGIQIVTACADNTAKLWNAITGECIKTLEGHEGGVLYTQFSPDGTQIVTAGRDHTAKIFSFITAKAIKAYGWDLYSVPLAQVIDWAQTGTIEKAPARLNEQPVSR